MQKNQPIGFDLSEAAAKAFALAARAEGKRRGQLLSEAILAYMTKYENGAKGIKIYPIPFAILPTMKRRIYHVTPEVHRLVIEATNDNGFVTNQLARAAIYELVGVL